MIDGQPDNKPVILSAVGERQIVTLFATNPSELMEGNVPAAFETQVHYAGEIVSTQLHANRPDAEAYHDGKVKELVAEMPAEAGP